MKSCYDDLDKMIKDFKSGKYSKEDKTIAFTPTELNLIRIIVGYYLRDVRHKDKHNIGDDISDYMRESLQDIENIYNKIIEHRSK